MANSFVDKTGDGVETDFTITMPYLDRDHLLVYVNGVLQTITTDYSFLSSTSIQFVVAPGDTLVVRIRRSSDRGTALADFSNGAMLTAEQLNTGNLQNLYLNQEAVDELALGVTGVTALGIDSESATDNYVLTADGSGGSAWETVPAGATGPTGATGPAGADGLDELVGDLTPQLGGNLDVNDKWLTGSFNVGDPGFELGSIIINDVTFSAPAKINHFGSSQDATLILHQHADTTSHGSNLVFARARGDTSTHDDVVDNDILGSTYYVGRIGTSYHFGARIHAEVDGTPGEDDMPSALVFSTTADGADVVTERMRLNAAGQLIVDPGLTGSVSLPSLAFGDGDTGFYESVDDTFYFTLGGINKFRITASTIRSEADAGQGWALAIGSIGPQQPAYHFYSDSDTGVGHPAADQGSLLAGGIEVAFFQEVASAVQLVVDPGMTAPSNLPALAFGDGDTGFRESTDDSLRMIIAGTERYHWSGNQMNSITTGSWFLDRNAASSTNPVFCINGDDDTGVGSNAADQLSLIAGGVEAFRIVEAAGLLTQSFIGSLQGNMITPIEGKTASYTSVLSDGGRTIRFTGSTASKVFTIDSNANVAYPLGTMIGIENDGSVTMTVAITTDSLTWSKDNTTGTRTLAAGASAVVKKVTATGWKFSGSALVT